MNRRRQPGALRISAFVLATLLASLLLSAWFVPPLLDWNRAREGIATLVSEKLGRPVAIEGPVSLALLPQPILTAGRIRLAPASDGTTITLSELRLRLALGPLLSGHIDAQELVLRGLDINLPWPASADPASLRAPAWLSSLSARIEDGSLRVGSLAVTGIDATLGTVAETGTIALAGQAQISGLPWHMTARLGQSAPNGAAGLDLSLDGADAVQGLGARFAGQISADGTVSGRVSGRGPDLSRVLPAPAVAFRAEGRVSLAAGTVIADQLGLDLAGSPARGAVTLRLKPRPMLDVALAASRLDLDSWLPNLLHGDTPATLAGQIPTSIDLSAEAATLASGTLRSLRGRFAIADQSVALHDVSAVLPGEAALQLQGSVSRGTGATAHFEGAAHVSAPNLRTTLAWLGASGLAPLGALPPGVLRTADLRATIAADGGTTPHIQLSDLQGVIDDMPTAGTLSLRPALPKGGRLGIGGQLTLAQLELDPWVAILTPPIASLPGRLGPVDLDLRLLASKAALRGHMLSQFTLDLATEPGKITLRQIEASAMGVHLAALGSLRDGGILGDARLELQADQDRAGPTLSAWWPALADLASHLPSGKLALTVTGAGPQEALALRAAADLGDLHLEAQPVLNLAAGRWNTAVSLRHPGAPRLLESIGLPGTAAWLGDGSLSLVATASGAAGKTSLDSFDLSAGSLRANGALTLDQTAATPAVGGHISADTLPLPLPYPRSREPLQTEALTGLKASIRLDANHVLFGLSPTLEHASATLNLAGTTAGIDALSAGLDGGSLTGSLSLDQSGATPRLTADLKLAAATLVGPLFELPLDLTGGALDMAASLSASGHSPQALLATLAGTASLSARNGDFAGVALDRIAARLDDASLREALAGGTSKFDQLSLQAQIGQGALSFTQSDIATPHGHATLKGLIDIADSTLDLRLAILPDVDDPPEIAVRLSGPFENPTRALELANALPWRAQHP